LPSEERYKNEDSGTSTEHRRTPSKKKRAGPGKTKKKTAGKKDRDSSIEKHQKMEEEEDSTDIDEDLTEKTARKLATQMSEKGERRHCCNHRRRGRGKVGGAGSCSFPTNTANFQPNFDNQL